MENYYSAIKEQNGPFNKVDEPGNQIMLSGRGHTQRHQRKGKTMKKQNDGQQEAVFARADVRGGD